MGLEAQSRFFRSVGAMLGAGMPLVSCLRSEEGQARGKIGAVARQLRGSVEDGATLSVAMGALSGTFDIVVVGMIKSAESSGRLSETMARIADMQTSAVKLRKRVRSATVYPVVVLVIALVVSVLLAVFVLPILAGVFDGKALPLPTRLVLRFSAWLRDWGLYLLAGLPAFVTLVALVNRTSGGARFFQACVLWVPVAGGIARKTAIARFSRVYGSLVQTGVPVLKALDLSAMATGNSVIESAVLRARAAVEHGEPLSSALARERSIPSTLVEMIRSGEKSGRVDIILDSAAVYYEQDVEAVLSMLPALIQPVLMVFAGIIVLFIALSVFLPLWGAIGNI